jgi:hypothetical protein
MVALSRTSVNPARKPFDGMSLGALGAMGGVGVVAAT